MLQGAARDKGGGRYGNDNGASRRYMGLGGSSGMGLTGMSDALAGLNISTSRRCLQIKASQISAALCCWHARRPCIFAVYNFKWGDRGMGAEL